jgi:hypothetical protein
MKGEFFWQALGAHHEPTDRQQTEMMLARKSVETGASLGSHPQLDHLTKKESVFG